MVYFYSCIRMFRGTNRLRSLLNPRYLSSNKKFCTSSTNPSPNGWNSKLMIGGIGAVSLGAAAYMVQQENNNKNLFIHHDNDNDNKNNNKHKLPKDIDKCQLTPTLTPRFKQKSKILIKSVTIPGIEPYSPSTTITKNHATKNEVNEITNMKHYKDKYPIIPLDQIREHYSPFVGDGSVWVTWKGGVYDVTKFMSHHPGGATRIEMAGGGDLSGYWKIYTLHMRDHIQRLLQKYRIGNLSDADRIKIESESSLNNHYITDPPRDPTVSHADTVTKDLIIASLHPYNVEPRSLRVLSSNFYTPNDLFWVRNHNAVPLIEEDEYELEISGQHINDITLSLNDLKTKFRKYEVPVTIQCAGNRQEDYNLDDTPLYVAPHWHNTAIGNAMWGGCKLRDVLRYCGLDVDSMALDELKYDDLHWVSALGYDEDETGVAYGGMIPIEKAIDAWGDCLLVYEMNNETLPRDHGYPIRLIAPGHAGCRQVKWLKTIELLDKPSSLDSGSKLDRHFGPNICFDQLRNEGDISNMEEDEHNEMDLAPVIQTMPVQSIICDWINTDNESLTVKGVAWAGGGKAIARVDVSIDNGNSFSGAKMITPIPTSWNRNWSWIHFEKTFDLTEKQKNQLKNNQPLNIKLVSKAVDDNFNAQPENMEPYYNVLGVCINHWKRVNATINPV